MGMESYACIDVSVTLKPSYANIELLRRLVGEQHPRSWEEPDRLDIAWNISNDDSPDGTEDELVGGDMLNLEELLASSTEGEFTARLIELGRQFLSCTADGGYGVTFTPTFHFSIEVCCASAVNLHERRNPKIFGECGTVDDTMEKLISGRQLFLRLGVPPQLIKVGYTFMGDT